MKFILLGLAGAAAITCALYFVFRAPEDPEVAADAGPPRKTYRTPRMADAPKSPATTSQGSAPKKRYYVNPAGQQFEFSNPGEVKLTSSQGQTLSGTYTKENDEIRMSFDNGEKKSEMHFIEVPHGIVGGAGGELGGFLATDDGGKTAAALRDGIQEHGKIVKMENNVNTLKAYVETYTALTKVTPPDLAALVKKGVLTDNSLLTDLWGRPIHYQTPAKRSRDSFDVFSAGPNGVEGDADDIGNWESAVVKGGGGDEAAQFQLLKKESKAVGDRLMKIKGRQ